ncbi:hypothetical protein AKJ42_02655 [candidate division MSBL1 archaeon SCGC-AAA261C02]|uniref:molybdopterin molybdotransferase n=1 Tax=candidate division MSBL1 archaeon SCGC-AAA261C02 TaxID=1698272 RepID=A0A133UZV9_9EURY|nr:hypothetical protein AKJ42_02655 [candidate division MSBL1 archaeon SCGC-AAA261C02]
MKDFLKVVPLEDAQTKLADHWHPKRQTTIISLEEASGRILAEDVTSKINLPPFDRAAVDGYALQASDTFGVDETNSAKLSRIGEIHAGKQPEIKVGSGTCVAIATGAVMPEGADAVVMVEDASEVNGTIEIRRAVSPGENVSEKGSEIAEEESIALAGQKISPQVHGALHAAGVQEVKAFEKPKVAVISSGEELVEFGKELQLGQIYDINGPTICDSVRACGGEPTHLGIVSDDALEIKKRVRKALSKHDIIITSGGSSAGSKDILPETINELGEPGVIVHGLAQKPGKPTLIAIIKDKPIFGLPGYPVSALMVFNQLVAPYLRELSGIPEPELGSVQASLTKKIISARGRRELVPVKLIQGEEGTLARPLRRDSGAITSLANASGYIDVPLSQEILEEGEIVTVKLYEGSELA